MMSALSVGAGALKNRPAMVALGAESDVIAQAVPYSNILFLLIPFTILIHVLSSILQGTGDTKTPMYALMGVNIVHILVAYPLIYGKWGAPAWGLQGAAWAVVIAESLGAG